MNIKGYRYLLALEEYGNISRAAASLSISQPALSKFLNGCESELSVRLFQRESSGALVPTEAGRIYLRTARQIIDIRNRTYASISQLTNAPIEVIRVGATPYRGAQTFAKLFAGFYERYPNITLELREGYMTQLKTWIMEGKLNMALGTVRPEDETKMGFASTSYETLMLSAPLSHPAAAHSNDSGTFFPEIDVLSFYDAPFVMWGKNTTNYELVRSYFDRLNFHPTVVFESDNALMVDEILKQDAGVGFIPHTFCKAHQNRVYFSTWPPLQTFLGVFFRKDRELSEAERYMIYLMIKGGMIGNTPLGDNAYLNRTSRAIVSEFE